MEWEKVLQIIHLKKDSYLEYIKNINKSSRKKADNPRPKVQKNRAGT